MFQDGIAYCTREFSDAITEFRERVSGLEITSRAEGIVEEIREISRFQKETWQRVPRLALETRDREGISSLSSRVSHDGYLTLECYKEMNPNSSRNHVYVDLATGELVVPKIEEPGYHGNCETAQNEDVARLAFNLSDLNAGKVVAILEREGEYDYHPFSGTEERAERAKEYSRSLTPEIFTRE